MAVAYLELGRAADLKEKKERFIFRFLEMLPGLLSLGTLIFAFIFSWLKPLWVAVFIILFDLYWTLKVVYFSFYQVSSFLKIKKNLKTDWRQNLEKLPNWKEIYQIIILPSYKEPLEVIEETIISLKEADYPKEKMLIVLALEERAGEKAKENGRILSERYQRVFGKFLVTFHPSGIEGEAIGKGSNVAWAAKEIKKTLEEDGIAFEKTIVSSFDIDTKVFPNYFLCLTYKYLTVSNSTFASFQPIPVYHNNIWNAPSFCRVVAISSTFWQMMQQERPEQLVTYSSHSIAGKAFFEVGYPSNVVSDDSRIFWKAYLKFDGNYRVVPLHFPVSMDVVSSSNIFKTIWHQYKQQKRWAWGCVEIPYILFGFLKNKKIKLRRKIFHSLLIFEGFWSWACASLLILILGWLPLFFGGEEFNISLFSYNLPRLTSKIMAFSMIGMAISALLNLLFLPPRPKKSSFLKNFSMVFQWLLLPVTLIIFGSLPALEAQIRLMLGKYLEFWNTPKSR